MKVQHLTDEQFTDLLSGSSRDSAAQAHLAECEPCRLELAGVKSAVESFDGASLAWASRQAPHLILTPSPWAVRSHAMPRWSAACAALVVMGVAFGLHGTREGTTSPNQTAAASTNTAPSSTALAEDNRLLLSIDQELTWPVRPQIPAAELQIGPNASRRGVPRRLAD